METITVELELSPDQYGELVAGGRAAPTAQSEKSRRLRSLNGWKVKPKIEQARTLMRELGKGLGKSTSKHHDVACNHDRYLYLREP